VVELGRASDRELVDRYEAGCEAYDELYLSEQLEKYEAALRLLRPRGRVVDVGCGTGLLVEYMAKGGDILAFGAESPQALRDLMRSFGLSPGPLHPLPQCDRRSLGTLAASRLDIMS